MEKYSINNSVHTKILQSISFVITNITNIEYANYLFSHFCINEILKFEFD